MNTVALAYSVEHPFSLIIIMYVRQASRRTMTRVRMILVECAGHKIRKSMNGLISPRARTHTQPISIYIIQQYML